VENYCVDLAQIIHQQSSPLAQKRFQARRTELNAAGCLQLWCQANAPTTLFTSKRLRLQLFTAPGSPFFQGWLVGRGETAFSKL
jgi:hypothetical protein